MALLRDEEEEEDWLIFPTAAAAIVSIHFILTIKW
jgi:hypothetical protein